jgi:hypothetical protein
MALPVMVLSLKRSNGVVDEWSIEKHLSGYTLQARSMGDGVGEAFPWISKPFLHFETTTPLLHYSTNPGI